MVENVIIIGSGPAGLSAAIYTAREGFNPLLIAGSISGGQLLLTTDVENMPGFPNGVQGPELIEMMRKQAEKFGTRFIEEDVTKVDFKSRPFRVSTASEEYQAHTVIVATGANAKTLGIPSESKFFGHGVSTCGTCDGPFFKNKDVLVVGGGDTAMEDSLFLTRFCKSVTIVHRRDKFRASKIMQDKVMSNPKIKVIWNSTITEIVGNQSVNGAVLQNLLDGKTTKMPTDGVFMAIGHSPNTAFLNGQLKLDDMGYIMTHQEVLTDIEGVYVAGDNADRFYRQAGTASSSGIKAALQVRDHLQKANV
ncbi:MAG TPA: thioredoxin-disulfide reductase [Candidatus Acidoferrum sp.]|nr:thioredoxin-disulfide reductase [Candidatus Acidoferrum sp.]